MKNFFKKLGYYLAKHDYLWTVAGSFFAFLLFQNYMQKNAGAIGTYDPNFLAPLFLTASIMFGIAGIVNALLWLNWRGLYRAIYKKDMSDGLFSRFKDLTACQLFVLCFSFVAFLFYMGVKIFLTFV
jgi:hypothetical protein